MVLPYCSLAAWAAEDTGSAQSSEEPLAVLYTGSDFQLSADSDNPDGAVAPDRTQETEGMTAILTAMKKDYPTIDEALFLGDYETSIYTSDATGITAAYGHVYVKDSSVSPQAYLDALAGTLTAGQIGDSVQPGGNVVVLTTSSTGSSTVRVPITVDMLREADGSPLDYSKLHKAGSYTVSVWYDGVEIYDAYTLTITGESAVDVQSYPGNGNDVIAYVISLDGQTSETLSVGSGGAISTGRYLTVYTYKADGSVLCEAVSVTINMLNATSAQLNTAGTHSGLTVTYEDNVITDSFNLVLKANVVHDYPDFPDAGSVQIGKEMDATNSKATGSAQINLSVSGVDLTAAFMAFQQMIHSANSAGLVDQLGDAFDLQNGTKGDGLDGASITIQKYDLYKWSEVGEVVNGVTVTEDMVGKRKNNSPTVLELVTFDSNGTPKNSSGNSVMDSSGVIVGQYFWYNTNTVASVMIDTDGIGTPRLPVGARNLLLERGRYPRG